MNLQRSAIAIVGVVVIVAATGCAGLGCMFNCDRFDGHGCNRLCLWDLILKHARSARSSARARASQNMVYNFMRYGKVDDRNFPPVWPPAASIITA